MMEALANSRGGGGGGCVVSFSKRLDVSVV